MKVRKTSIANLEKCYSIAKLEKDGAPYFLVAAEKHAACLLFDYDGNLRDTVWTAPGGVMSMEQAPGSNGAFLATHEFYSPNDSADARIVIATPGKDGWGIRTLVELPFVHRFGLLHNGDRTYLVACTLKSAHAFKNDWTCPGRIWVAPLPGDLSANDMPAMSPLVSGLYKNHGFYIGGDALAQYALVGTENGIYRITPPQSEDGEWQSERIIADAVSDMTQIDLDGDGEKEIVAYAPFHGAQLLIYKRECGEYRCVYRHAAPLAFLHAIWSGTLNGRPTALVGHRGGEMALFALTYDGGYRMDTIDTGSGPANVSVINRDGRDVIVAANRETDEIAMYEVEW